MGNLTRQVLQDFRHDLFSAFINRKYPGVSSYYLKTSKSNLSYKVQDSLRENKQNKNTFETFETVVNLYTFTIFIT